MIDIILEIPMEKVVWNTFPNIAIEFFYIMNWYLVWSHVDCEPVGKLSEITEWSALFPRNAVLRSKAGQSWEKKSIPLLLTTQVYQNKIK